ncbi:TetR/AcrR family transcriptional regulator [Cellulomonas taurus]|uniref:TetR/AcrR family transcriptional regulator n=1 Tax=Cellulomonas taurus TaxID=2729175 RepID=UPI00145D91AF|nr:TetR/AcrR family transcriptional regulator [Cellulomonas taurus]
MATPTPGQRRPARMPRDLRRAQVLRVAQELFTAEGYHHVSMDDIADRAEVSKPVLYRHFPSKLDLYLTVVDARGTDLLSTVDAAIDQVQDARDAITGVVLAYLHFVDRTGEAAALLFESDVTHDPDVRARVERATDLVTERLTDVLTGVPALSPAPAGVLAQCLAAMAQQVATRRLRDPGSPDARQTAALVTRLAWGGVRDFLPPEDSAQGERSAVRPSSDLG